MFSITFIEKINAGLLKSQGTYRGVSCWSRNQPCNFATGIPQGSFDTVV